MQYVEKTVEKPSTKVPHIGNTNYIGNNGLGFDSRVYPQEILYKVSTKDGKTSEISRILSVIATRETQGLDVTAQKNEVAIVSNLPVGATLDDLNKISKVVKGDAFVPFS